MVHDTHRVPDGLPTKKTNSEDVVGGQALDAIDLQILRFVASGGESLMQLVGTAPAGSSRTSIYRRKDSLVHGGFIIVTEDGRLRLGAEGKRAMEVDTPKQPETHKDLRSQILPYLPKTPLDAEQEAEWIRLRDTIKDIGMSADKALRILKDYSDGERPVARLREEKDHLTGEIGQLKREADAARLDAEEAVLATKLTVDMLNNLNELRDGLRLYGAIDYGVLRRWVERQRRLDELHVDSDIVERVGKEATKHGGNAKEAFKWMLLAQTEYGTLSDGIAQQRRECAGLKAEVEKLREERETHTEALALLKERTEATRTGLEKIHQELEDNRTERNRLAEEVTAIAGVKGDIVKAMNAVKERSNRLDKRERELVEQEALLKRLEQSLLEREQHVQSREDHLALGELVPGLILGKMPPPRPVLARSLRRLAEYAERPVPERHMLALAEDPIKRLGILLRKVVRENFVPQEEHEARLRQSREELDSMKAAMECAVQSRDIEVERWKRVADQREEDITAMDQFFRDPSRMRPEQSKAVLSRYAALFRDTVEVAWRSSRWAPESTVLCGACHRGSIMEGVPQPAVLLGMADRAEKLRFVCRRCGRTNAYDAMVLLATTTHAAVSAEVVG